MIRLKGREILELWGSDASFFLNNLLTNSINANTQHIPVYAALLGPQGKFLFDLFIIETEGSHYFIETNHANELEAKLKLYRMRWPIEMKLRPDLAVFSHNDDKSPMAFQDPRNPNLGFRVFAPIETLTDGEFIEYENKRLELGIPDPSRDLIRDSDFALEGLLDEMGAIDFQKGCFIGQEMTSRMKRRGTLKQKLVKIRIIGETPEFDTAIMANETEIGRLRTNNGQIGLALMRIDRAKIATENNIKMLANGAQILIDATAFKE